MNGPGKSRETCMILLLKVFSFLADGLGEFGNNVPGNFPALVKIHLLLVLLKAPQLFLIMKRFACCLLTLSDCLASSLILIVTILSYNERLLVLVSSYLCSCNLYNCSFAPQWTSTENCEEQQHCAARCLAFFMR